MNLGRADPHAHDVEQVRSPLPAATTPVHGSSGNVEAVIGVALDIATGQIDKLRQ
jgi:hypothetical protein